MSNYNNVSTSGTGYEYNTFVVAVDIESIKGKYPRVGCVTDGKASTLRDKLISEGFSVEEIFEIWTSDNAVPSKACYKV